MVLFRYTLSYFGAIVFRAQSEVVVRSYGVQNFDDEFVLSLGVGVLSLSKTRREWNT